ncbi:MAG: Unknown protein [uncultured Sulfurovum sp.]|uniref:Uncharacterized protein n=1 Tax=uncultured Sulfurovum sp. TaxID=269237 RepID=A0A6S6U147_9BACT|nr:MAG: Unknown protein [uncultured Sulfurovum sp.]
MELEPIENPIVIHPHLLQRFLKQGKDYANLLALYSFYLYHAQLQKTNQPLATDEFTRKGMNWAIDRVKKTKKLLKEMKLIEVVQKKKYYYIHLFFIYTKKKIGEILGTSTESEASAPNKPKTTKNETTRLKPSVPSVPILLEKWLLYCDKNAIKYSKNNLHYWNKKLENRLSIDQQKAIYTAMSRGWKDFYLVSIKESKYHKFLGKSLMMEKDCDTLVDIAFKEKRFIYQFKNIKISTTEPPSKLFERYGYDKSEVKKAPIVSDVKSKILGLIQRF